MSKPEKPRAFTTEMICQGGNQFAESTTSEIRLQPTTGAGNYSTAGSSISFRIDRMPQTFLENSTLTLNGRVAITAGATANTNLATLLGYAGSFFQTLRVKSNGITLDDITNFAQLNAKIFDFTMSRSDKVALSPAYLFDPITNAQGVVVNGVSSIGAGNRFNGFPSGLLFSFSIPIPCSVTNASSFWPLYASDLEFEFVLASPTAIFVASAGTISPSFTLMNMELVANVIKLESAPFAQLISRQPLDENGFLEIKTDMWGYYSANLIASQPAGRNDVQIAVQKKSIKRIMLTTQPSNAAELSFAGVNPNLESIQFVIGTDVYPKLPMRVNNPAEVMTNIRKALGGVYQSGAGTLNPFAFCKASTIYNPYYYSYNTDPTYLNTTISAATSLTTLPATDPSVTNNKWVMLLDLEAISGNKELMFNGVSTRGSISSYIRFTHEAALAAVAHTLHIWTNYDAVIRIDPVNFQTSIDD
ncbi:MAG: hypothetical protein EOO43_01535 [Flavobacterium sp.]|nr:MAG: hypothetical protein EOO43_01535 [Flavobacterium sp.]